MQTKRQGKDLAGVLKLLTPEQFIQVLECIEDGIYVADDDGMVLYINQTAADMLGRDRHEMIGLNIWDEFPQMVNSHPYLEWKRVAREREDSHFKTLMPIVCQWIDVMMYYCDDVGVITVMRNIHEWTISEERSKGLRDLMESLGGAATLEQVTQAILDKGLAILQGDKGWVALLNKDGQTFRLLFSAEDSNVSAGELPLTKPSPITDAINTREALFIESAADYAVRYPEPAKAGVKGADGLAVAAMPLMVQERVIGALAISIPKDQEFEPGERDFFIALAHQCAQAIDRALVYDTEAEARRAAERANAMRMQFIGMLSHELRTPLTTIRGFTSTLLSRDVEWERASQEEFLSIIDYEAERLTELVDDLLELSRIEAGHFKVSPQRMELYNILADALPAMTTLGKDHELTVDVPISLPDVMADAKRTGQVLINLVSNAAKHSPPNTIIAIRAYQTGDMIQVDVADQGSGIAPEVRETLFEPFRQGNGREATHPGGAGLGLTIAKAIIDAQGGRIWFQDQDVGTTVSFTIPVAMG